MDPSNPSDATSPSAPNPAPLPAAFKSELRAAANASLRRHLTSLPTPVPQPPSPSTLASFSSHLHSSKRIIALLGAGLSASSGIPTYRSAGGLWRTYSDAQLATAKAFEEDPGLVWRFYEERRVQAKRAEPNKAHWALAGLGRGRGEGMLVVNQNVDGLCERASHPPDQLINLHGSLFRVKCASPTCTYEAENLSSHLLPTPSSPSDLSDPSIPLPPLPLSSLPTCPQCTTSLLRPAVTWFGEELSSLHTARIDDWIAGDSNKDEKIDLLLVIGTSAVVYPAAAYIEKARKKGARVAFFNMEVAEAGVARPESGDWVFRGDAAVLVPLALGEVEERII